MSARATPIGIAIVEQEGRYLVGIRGSDTDLAGKAEFPGGKCRPNESPSDCAVRECQEETGLSVVPVKLLHNQQFDYQHGCVDLHFWICRPTNLFETETGARGFRWVSNSELSSLDFPAGNAHAIALLTHESSH